MPFKFSIRTALILIAILAVTIAVVLSNPRTHGQEGYGFYQGGPGPMPYLEAYSDLLESAESLQLTPTEKPSWSRGYPSPSNPSSWYVVQENSATIWVRVSASNQHAEAAVLVHKDCMPWQDVSAEQDLFRETSMKLAAWWRAWKTERGWP